MAAEQRIASRYAKSLLDLAQERGVVEIVHQDMQFFNDTLNGNRELVLLLKNPIIRNDKKKAVLRSLFTGRINELTGKFLEIISNKNREDVLPEIATDFLAQYRVLAGITRAEVVTTTPITPELRTRFIAIVADITGNKVELIEKVNPGLIGGYILRIGDRQIDESISSKLTELEAEFKQNTYVKAF